MHTDEQIKAMSIVELKHFIRLRSNNQSQTSINSKGGIKEYIYHTQQIKRYQNELKSRY